MAWPGGKDGAGVFQRLVNEIPPHDVFVSAFLGDCAILRRKRPAGLSIGIDMDRENVERWARSPFDAPLELYCCDALEWLRHRFGWYQVAKIGGPDRDAGNGDSSDRAGKLLGSRLPATLDRATAAAAAGNGVAGSGDAVLGGGGPKIFVYADPPYMLGTRRSKSRLYNHDMSDEQHADLVGTLKAAPCLVMVSHYPCPLYDEMFADWRSFTFTVQTRGGRKAIEKVWCNYPPPVELHDARYLGLNKRQRERVRRRVKNWTAGLARMHPLERQAILDGIGAPSPVA